MTRKLERSAFGAQCSIWLQMSINVLEVWRFTAQALAMNEKGCWRMDKRGWRFKEKVENARQGSRTVGKSAHQGSTLQLLYRKKGPFEVESVLFHSSGLFHSQGLCLSYSLCLETSLRAPSSSYHHLGPSILNLFTSHFTSSSCLSQNLCTRPRRFLQLIRLTFYLLPTDAS